MRTTTRLRILSVGLMLTTGVHFSYAQQKLSIDSTRKMLDKLLVSKDSADRNLLRSQLELLNKNDSESDLILARNYYYRLGNTKKAEEIQEEQLKRFPLGVQSRGKESEQISKLKTPQEQEAAYNAWVTKYPPAKFDKGGVDDLLAYDYLRSAIASGYARQKNVAKAREFANALVVDFWKGNAYASLAQAFYSQGNLQEAETYAKLAMDNAESYTDGKKGNSNAAKFAASAYPGLTGTYANILFEQKKYPQALQYSEIAYKKSIQLSPQLNYRYAQILHGLNRDQEAYEKLEEVVKAGKATPAMAKDFKELYIKVKGSDKGFDDYAAAIRKSYLEDLNKRLQKDIISEKASDFTLSDINGKRVSLADLKGKVVILDFWATWCGPCKASFPAMQMAENKFKDDPNVKFLFIHTWEQSATPLEDASKYVKDNKYDFTVLMDIKDPATKVNKVVSSYKVNGIPAKFVIDGNGNIRFKLTGFDGSNEAAVDELSAMVKMAKG